MIVRVPANETESWILELLREKNVVNVHRIIKNMEDIQPPSTIIVLTFSQPIPYRVTMGYRSFVLRAYFPRPMQCFNCHRIGHTIIRCKLPKRCPSGAGSQPPSTNCESKAKCINCQKDSFLTGSAESPIYTLHLNAPKFARANNISMLEAKQQLLALRNPIVQISDRDFRR